MLASIVFCLRVGNFPANWHNEYYYCAGSMCLAHLENMKIVQEACVWYCRNISYTQWNFIGSIVPIHIIEFL